MTIYVSGTCKACGSADKALKAAQKVVEAVKDLIVRKSGKQRQDVKFAVEVFEAAMADYGEDRK